MTTAQQQAIRDDAERQLIELRAVARVLWPDRDDPLVQSELTVIESQIAAAEAVLNGSSEA